MPYLHPFVAYHPLTKATYSVTLPGSIRSLYLNLGTLGLNRVGFSVTKGFKILSKHLTGEDLPVCITGAGAKILGKSRDMNRTLLKKRTLIKVERRI